MIKFIMQFFMKFISNCKTLQGLIKINLPEHPYRVLSIEQDDNKNYIALIQVTQKGVVLEMAPEEILENDKLTDSFSQRDIRALTYLGYLGINSPKYKILAKRLSEKDDNITFSIKERGKKKPILKTAMEISSDEAFIRGLHQKDAHMIGYTTATEQVIAEKEQMKLLREALEHKRA